jgi:PTS system N-acetylglucosamine-specific IIB component
MSPDKTQQTQAQRHRAQQIYDALGGTPNVHVIEPCITRLRVQVDDPGQVDEDALRAAGALGVVMSGRIIQVIVGPEADELAGVMSNLAAAG